MDTFSKLSKRERQILQVLLRQGEATAQQVQEMIPDSPTNAAVRRLLAILEEKGHISHRQEGQRYVYFPALNIEKEKTSAIASLKETFFSGSAVDAVAAMIDTSIDELSDEDIQELHDLIKKARSEGR